MTKKGSSGNKKKKGSPLPLIIIVIIGFLVYKANPEYWQQGRLFHDWKNGVPQVETEEVVKAPEAPKKPDVDPDAILEGSAKGAKTIPINIRKTIGINDPNYEMFRSKFKTLYLVTQKSSSSEQLANQIRDAIKEEKLNDEFTFNALLYEAKDKKHLCGLSETQTFFCKQCDRKICIVHPRKLEYIVVAPTVQASIGRAKVLKKEGW